jgi:putative ABC transport system permease protein
MSWFARLRNVLRPRRHLGDVDRELAFHLAETTDRLVADGMPPEAAAREAARRFGHRPGIRERTRDVDVVVWLESFFGDLRYAIRVLRAAPGFTVVAVLSLGLGIGANTAIFSLVDAAILRSLPVTHPEQLVKLAMGNSSNDVFTNPLWEEIRARGELFDGLFAFGSDRFNLVPSGQARLVDGDFVSGDYFRTLGVGAAIGRLLQVADDRRGCPPLAVVSYGFWQSEFGGSPEVIGARLSLNGHSFSIIGAAVRGFTGVDVGRFPHVYIPICAEPLVHGAPGMLDERSAWWIQLVGRLPPGASLTQANGRLAVESPAIFAATLPAAWGSEGRQAYLKNTLLAVPAATGLSGFRLQARTALVVLMGVVGVVLLIACANVANLLLARAAARQREIAMRLAIGASRGRIVRQMLTESILLSSAGALLGLAFARWGDRVLVGLLSSRGQQVSLDLSVDTRLLVFTLAVAVCTGILFGVAPAWRSVRQDPQGVLKVGGPAATATRSALTTSKMLVASQVALALVLVATAGLLLGSFRTLTSLDPGFRPDGVALAQVNFQSLNMPQSRRELAGQEMLEQLRINPGIEAASASLLTPVSGRRWNSLVLVDGYTPTGETDNLVWFNGVTDGYFATLGIDFVTGRDFTGREGSAGERVAIITRSLARKFFGETSPLGRQFRIQGGGEPGPPVEVIGVVEDAKYSSLRDSTAMTVYVPWSQAEHWGSLTFEVRGRGEMTDAVAATLAAARTVIPGASLNIGTLSGQLAGSLARERLLATLSAFFGGLALLLALVGLYGTMAYNVTRRRKEIGIRIALGASRFRLMGMVLREVCRVIVAGVVIGGLAIFATSRLVRSFLYGRTPLDPVTLAVAALAVAAVALLAGALPAVRASRQDPQVTLREE